jgi:hypothetical protein
VIQRCALRVLPRASGAGVALASPVFVSNNQEATKRGRG